MTGYFGISRDISGYLGKSLFRFIAPPFIVRTFAIVITKTMLSQTIKTTKKVWKEMERAWGRSRWRTERRQSPAAAETVFGAGKENLWLARAELSAMSGIPSASASKCVARRVSGNRWRAVSTGASADDGRRRWGRGRAAGAGVWERSSWNSELGIKNVELGMVGFAD